LLRDQPIFLHRMKTARAENRMFRVFPKLNVPNGAAYWKIEGWPNGKRKRYYFQTQEQARKAAEDRNNQLISFGAGEVMPESDRLMALECIWMARERGHSLYEATHLACSIWDRQETSITVEELCKRVTVYYNKLALEDPSKKGNTDCMNYVARKFGAAFGNRAIKTLDGAEIRTWLEGEGLSDKTRTNCLKYIKRMFNLARGWKGQDGNKLLEKDAFERVEGFGEGHTDGVKVLNVEQTQAFLNAVRPEFVPLFALNLFSGFRSAEITRMDWSNIDLGRRLIILPARKHKTGKLLRKRKMNEGIFENLVDWLTPYRRESGPVANFTKNDLQAEITRASKTAGFKWIRNALRHSFASYAVPIKGFVWTSLNCGHTEQVLRDHYHEVAMLADAERYWNIFPPAAPANVIAMDVAA
jgi:integrase